MGGEKIRVKATGGEEFDAYHALPEGGPGPGVVMVQEIFGLTSAILEAADMFADQGYAVLAPDMFWRQERGFVADYYSEVDRAKAHRLHDANDYRLSMVDITDAAETLKSLAECNGRIAVTGFCMGGNCAYLAAARLKIDAAAGYYGTHIHTYLGEAENISCPLILHIASHDHTCGDEDRSEVRGALADYENVTLHMYDTGHAFANVKRPDVYVPAAARAANQRSFVLFDSLK